MKRHKNVGTADPNTDETSRNADFHGGVLSIPRSRGALSGTLLIIFGAWAALIPATAAFAVGRLSVRSVRDVRVAQKHERKRDAKQRVVDEAGYQRGREDAERERAQREAQSAQSAQSAQTGQPGPTGPTSGQ